jgi:hypothetical protein
MIAVRLIRGIAGVAGLGALTLGLLSWIANLNFISIHMLFGLTVALSLLTLGVVGVFTRGMRLLGALGIVYALFVPAFGVTQATLLVGSLHWLIRAAHLLVGLLQWRCEPYHHPRRCQFYAEEPAYHCDYSIGHSSGGS